MDVRANHRARTGRRGLTMVEASISTLLLTVVLGGAVRLAETSQGAFTAGAQNHRALAQTRRAADRLVRELRGAGLGTMASQPLALGSSVMDFRVSEGWAAGAVQWGPAVRFAFEYAPGELDNGLDDDGNGLADDGVLALYHDFGGPAQRRAVLLTGISELAPGELANGADDDGNGLTDEGGLSFELRGSELVVRITTMRPGPGSLMTTATVETAVAILIP